MPTNPSNSISSGAARTSQKKPTTAASATSVRSRSSNKSAGEEQKENARPNNQNRSASIGVRDGSLKGAKSRQSAEVISKGHGAKSKLNRENSISDS